MGYYIISHFVVIRLGLEPKTYCLEGSCSIQLSYRTGLVAYDILLRKSAAKVDIFSETAKLFCEILQRNVILLFFGRLPIAVDYFAVLRFFIDVHTNIACETTYIEVLIEVI